MIHCGSKLWQFHLKNVHGNLETNACPVLLTLRTSVWRRSCLISLLRIRRFNYRYWEPAIVGTLHWRSWRHWLEGAEQPDHNNLEHVWAAKQLDSCQVGPLQLSFLPLLNMSHQFQPESAPPHLEGILPSTCIDMHITWEVEDKTLTLMVDLHWGEHQWIHHHLPDSQHQRSHQALSGLLHPLPVPHLPWSNVSSDLVTGVTDGNTVVLMVGDWFSKTAVDSIKVHNLGTWQHVGCNPLDYFPMGTFLTISALTRCARMTTYQPIDLQKTEGLNLWVIACVF